MNRVSITLKTRQLKEDDLRDFIACYHSENRHERQETERFRYYRHADLIARDKASLDIFWLKDDSLDDLPPPEMCNRRSSTTWKRPWPRSGTWRQGCDGEGEARG